jgi:2-C-methyl-D-erythritol 2,4-cyclodiphosphate synthase
LTLLGDVVEVVRGRGYQVVNVDAVVVCEEPKVAPYRGAMRERIASCLDVDSTDVSVKGTTTEGMGFTGRGEGVAAMAVVTIVEV